MTTEDLEKERPVDISMPFVVMFLRNTKRLMNTTTTIIIYDFFPTGNKFFDALTMKFSEFDAKVSVNQVFFSQVTFNQALNIASVLNKMRLILLEKGKLSVKRKIPGSQAQGI